MLYTVNIYTATLHSQVMFDAEQEAREAFTNAAWALATACVSEDVAYVTIEDFSSREVIETTRSY